MTIAGYSVQLVGIGGLATSVALGSQQGSGTMQTAADAFAIGGVAALIAGTLMAATGSPYMYGPPPGAFIEMK